MRESAQVWRSLRQRRATPPGNAGRSQIRSDTFRSALEQAEQQFRAAESVDYESRALNLYYGTSQAGRAVAAAATILGQSEWTLHGHGLKLSNVADVDDEVAALTIMPQGKGDTSFARLSDVLGSPRLTEQVTLGTLWPLMYETTLHAPLGDARYPPLHVFLEQRLSVGVHGVDSAAISLPDMITCLTVEKRQPVGDFIARYPALKDGQTPMPVGTGIPWPEHNDRLMLQWQLSSTEAKARHILGDRLTRYRGYDMAFPALAMAGTPMHPLMAWWAVLYGLSMLTRYEPAKWTRMIDVNRAEHATAIEFVLDTALAAVPDLLDEAIDFVSARAEPTEP